MSFSILCEALGCEPYLVFNVGSATVRGDSLWLEYITFDGDTEMTRLRKKNGREKPWRLKYICMEMNGGSMRQPKATRRITGGTASLPGSMGTTGWYGC